MTDGRCQIIWSANNPFDAVRVYWSTSPKDINITRNILVYAKSKNGSVIVDNPAKDKCIYFYVEGVQNTGVAAADRLLDIGKIYNFRDLGGYETSDGRHVKWGKLYRSSQLVGLTPDELKKIEALHIDVIGDFRSDSEIVSTLDTMIPTTKYVRLNANVSSVYNAADLAATFNSGNFAELGKPGEAMTNSIKHWWTRKYPLFNENYHNIKDGQLSETPFLRLSIRETEEWESMLMTLILRLIDKIKFHSFKKLA
ncbi:MULTISPECIES: tyrosine-protein phosphatase [Paenibacillus]|uniref:Uncharacterized protein n=1 Tax=Paenibacillus albilobatus TaxID=2716884 RepID=A0A919XHS8_9BACL|nr:MULTISPECIES: tyrosine-protein phosphatase [Paenibacillus]GIO31027.1 hypothetical protein J2TS6_21680 [Paenibacillus albilobatus]